MSVGQYFCEHCQEACVSADCPDCDRPAKWLGSVPHLHLAPPSPRVTRSTPHELNAAEETSLVRAYKIPAAEWFRRMREQVANAK